MILRDISGILWYAFEPEKLHDSDQDTVLLLRMDQARGPWLLDAAAANRIIAVSRGGKLTVAAGTSARSGKALSQ